MLPIVNISAYLFTELDELERRRAELLKFCRDRGLKGTILLSAEGINMFVAGARQDINDLLSLVREDSRLAELEAKESFSDDQPFSRMLVKIKKEIIAFGIDGIEPAMRTSPKLKATELKQWLDEGREVTLLDVRNDYEVDIGTFEGALPIGVDHFRDFPSAVADLPEDLKEKPVVMFCTGGIRCEKAGPFMEQAGFPEIYQLDGGILKYFEECGGDHYDGECFVFDKRVALDPALQETTTEQCYACLAPLTEEDQRSDKYEPPHRCPHCYVRDDIRMQNRINRLHDRLAEACATLPGSVPYENRRPISVPGRYDRWTVLDFLSDYHAHRGRDNWAGEIAEGRVLRRDAVVDADAEVRAGERLLNVIPGTVEPDVANHIKVLFYDDDLLVINKPAPIPVHPCGRFNRNSLAWILGEVLKPRHARPAHRLDANTSGVQLFSMNRKAAAHVQKQFRDGVAKRYAARVHGQPESNNFACEASISDGPGPLGARTVDPDGLTARTEFSVLKRFEDGTTLLECIPITGRTNQIRIHLWHLGIPICGDPVWLQDSAVGDTQTLGVEDPPLCLHAAGLVIEHPLDGRALELDAPLPGWAEQ
jgi:RluA family pseudouridine synthase